MTKDNIFFLRHIIDDIRDIENFMKNVSREKFDKNKEKQNAVIKSIENIGEATRNLPIDFTVKYPYVEWPKIIAMKNRLVHDYFGIDIETVWKVIKEDIPLLKTEIQKIINIEKA